MMWFSHLFEQKKRWNEKTNETKDAPTHCSVKNSLGSIPKRGYNALKMRTI